MPLTGPTKVKSSLGEMTVVPDDFTGPLPPGAVRQSEHTRMQATFDHIASGQSQVQFDTSSFLAGKDPVADPAGYLKATQDAAAFRQKYLDDMKDLVKTDVGLDLLSSLDGAKNKTTIKQGARGRNETHDDDYTKGTLKPDGTPGEGTGATVSMNPALTSYATPGQAEAPWMTERDKFGFYHELVHAYHDGRGDAAPGDHVSTIPGGAPRSLANLEFQAMGLGPYASEKISDNAIRAAMGKAERPNYGGYSY
jgi:hypothetical protein